MSDNKIVLHPVDPWQILQDPPELVEALRGLGLMGAGFPYLGDMHYKAGPRLHELVVFHAAAGAPPAEAPHFTLTETSVHPIFLGGANAQGPVCTACKARFFDWKEQLLAWQTERQKHTWRCPRCHAGAALEQLDWGTTGGVARYSLEIWGIPAGAAEPAAELLSFLERQTFGHWRYFYYRF
jgi:hypothetical protein